MAQPAYMKITGDVSGDILGGSTVVSLEREDCVEIIEIEHHLQIPFDPLDGRITGRRQHKPLKVRARIDQATALLYNALCTAETLQVTIRFFRASPMAAGQEEHYYTVELQDANVAQITLDTPNMMVDSERVFPDMVIYSFIYSHIVWTYIDGGLTAEDSWQDIRS